MTLPNTNAPLPGALGDFRQAHLLMFMMPVSVALMLRQNCDSKNTSSRPSGAFTDIVRFRLWISRRRRRLLSQNYFRARVVFLRPAHN